MNTRQNNSESLLSTLASITVPLIQLVAVSSLTFSEQVKSANVFVNTDILPLVNISIILVILGLIGALSTLEKQVVFPGNQPGIFSRVFTYLLFKIGIVLPAAQGFSLKERLSVRLLKPIVVFQFLSFSYLLSAFMKIQFLPNEDYHNFSVYFFYALFSISSGLLIFIWLEKYIERRGYVKQEDHFPRLIERLRDTGKLVERRVELKNYAMLQGSNLLFRVKIEKDSEYYILTDFSVNVINGMWKASEAPLEIVNQFAFDSQNTQPTVPTNIATPTTVSNQTTDSSTS